MGILGNILGGIVARKVATRATATRTGAQAGQYIPAGQAGVPSTVGGGNVLARAKDIYAQNPKLVTTLGTAALAVVLASYARKRKVL